MDCSVSVIWMELSRMGGARDPIFGSVPFRVTVHFPLDHLMGFVHRAAGIERHQLPACLSYRRYQTGPCAADLTIHCS